MKNLVTPPLFGAFVFLAFLSFIIPGCKIEAEAIEYGHDQCHYCKMNIVDKEHASQFVTEKGKQFKFDAIECMVNELKEKKDHKTAILLVSNYGASTMTDAKTATFLVSPEIRSPMGANLSGFSTADLADKAQKKHGGKTYTWNELEAVVEKVQ